MSDSLKVRASRDGDQFHYLWAARRCLRLLSSKDGLVAISIEDPPAQETAPGESLDAGVEQIDVAEYYGSEDVEKRHVSDIFSLNTRLKILQWLGLPAD